MCFLCKTFSLDEGRNHSPSLENRLIFETDQNLLNPSLSSLVKKEDAYYSGFSVANTFDSISGSNSFIEGLMFGGRWGRKDPDTNKTTELRYYLYGLDTNDFGNETYGILSAEKDAIQETHKAFSDIANITFTSTKNKSSAEIKWSTVNKSYYGMAAPPVEDYLDYAGEIEVAYNHYWNEIEQGSIDPGSFYYLTFTHELGHALGLSHPHDSITTNGTTYENFPGVSEGSAGALDGGDNYLNSTPFTVMTYNDSTSTNGYSPSTDSYSGFLTNLGAFDVAAIQYLYGANKSTRTDDDTYFLDDNLNGYSCIWDNGGQDTISAKDKSQKVTIDLRNASLKNKDGGGGFVSRYGTSYNGYTIAYNSTGDCVIEEAIGGKGSDTLYGNDVNNVLDGGKGNDKLYGVNGNDTLYGVKGNDILDGGDGSDYIDGGSGKDTAVFGSNDNTIDLAKTTRQDTNEGNDTLLSIENVNAGSGDDIVKGNGSNNILSGEAGDDTLNGGDGNDKIYGGDGIDTVVFSSRSNHVDLRNRNSQNTRDGNDILRGIENVTAGSGSDVVTGNSSSNILKGEDGNDKLYGVDGDDTLNGGDGNDKMYGGDGSDTAVFSSRGNRVDLRNRNSQNTRDGNDILRGIENVTAGSGSDVVNGDNNINTLRGEDGSDKLYGHDGNDTLMGGDGNDKLYGGNGVDTLLGGDGDDWLIGGLGNDQVYGGNGEDIFRIEKGSGRAVIQDFVDGTDKIHLGSGTSGINITSSNGNALIHQDGDFLAIIRNAAGELSQSGSYLI